MNTETVWTNEELELLYRQCRNCANRYRRAFSLAEDDALDAASNAYLAALKYLPRLVPVRRDQALKALAHSKVVDQLRQRNLLANRIFATAYRLDAAGGDDHSASSPPPLIGDGGEAGAGAIGARRRAGARVGLRRTRAVPQAARHRAAHRQCPEANVVLRCRKGPSSPAQAEILAFSQKSSQAFRPMFKRLQRISRPNRARLNPN